MSKENTAVLNFHKVNDTEFKSKSSLSQWGFLFVQLILSFLGAFAIYNTFGYDAWSMVAKQETNVIILNIAEVSLFVVFLFVGSTSYARGFMNTIKKWFGIIVPVVLILVINWLMLEQYGLPIGSGLVALASIAAFYFMFSMSSTSMSPMGFIASIAALIIGIMSVNHYLFDSTLSTKALVNMFQFSVVLVFFLGINWSKISYALSGVRSVNKADIPGGTSEPSGNLDDNMGED